MPTLCHFRPIHRVSDRLRLRVNVTLRDIHVAMPRQVRQRPRVHVWRPPREASMAERVQIEVFKL